LETDQFGFVREGDHMTDQALGKSVEFTKLAWGANQAEQSVVSAEAARDERLVADLERILRYASTARQVEAPQRMLTAAAAALQGAKSALGSKTPLNETTELGVLQAIDQLIPVIRPATAASLEIAEVMEVGWASDGDRQREIRRRVKGLIARWMWATLMALFLALVAIGSKTSAGGALVASLPIVSHLASYAIPLLLGFLGACCYILRTSFHGLAAQTFVLRDGADILRSILGIVVGFMVPSLLANGQSFESLGFAITIALPFLAGYAVEPIFGALDTIIVTIRDVVSRQPTFSRARNRQPTASNDLGAGAVSTPAAQSA
jgi:hypothetical protein